MGGFYTGKIFEYIKTGRPCWCNPGKGAAAGIIEGDCTGLVSDFNDIKGIGDKLYAVYRLEGRPGNLQSDNEKSNCMTEEISQSA